jgi:hypothetical protein
MMRTDMKKQMSGAPKKSKRPKMRPEMDDSAPTKSMRPKMRPEMIGNTPGSQGTRGINPKDNYSEEDFKKLTGGMKKGGKVKKMACGGKTKKMMGGGMAKAYKSGGKVRGYGMARGGKACKMR